MRAESGEVLSAFVDGESFEPSELATALAEPGARDMLVDFVLLQRALDADDEPSPEFVAGMRARLRPRRMRHGLGLLAAAAVVAVAVLGVLELGDGGRPALEGKSPPEPARELRFETGVDWQPVTRK